MDYAKLRHDKNERDGFASIVLHQNTEAFRKADCDRSSVRVFEAQLACQSHGDWLSGSRAAQKAVGKFIIEVAKNNGLFFTEESLSSLGERKMLPSGESVIYVNPAQGVVYKVRDPFAKLHLKSNRAIDVLYDHIVHNVLFPDTKYNLIGVTSVIDEVRLMYSQQFVFSSSIPTERQIEQYLVQIGLHKEDEYFYGNEFVSVTDVSATSDNVLLTEDGKLAFIDPIIKMKKPIDDIIDYYVSQGARKEQKKSLESKHFVFEKIKSWLRNWKLSL